MHKLTPYLCATNTPLSSLLSTHVYDYSIYTYRSFFSYTKASSSCKRILLYTGTPSHLFIQKNMYKEGVYTISLMSFTFYAIIVLHSIVSLLLDKLPNMSSFFVLSGFTYSHSMKKNHTALDAILLLDMCNNHWPFVKSGECKLKYCTWERGVKVQVLEWSSQ